MNSSEDEEERRSDWWKHWVMFYLFGVAVMYGYQVQVGRHTGIGSSFGVSRFALALRAWRGDRLTAGVLAMNASLWNIVRRTLKGYLLLGLSFLNALAAFLCFALISTAVGWGVAFLLVTGVGNLAFACFSAYSIGEGWERIPPVHPSVTTSGAGGENAKG